MTELQDRLQQALGEAFDIERELGGGGMSRVLLARDRKLGRRVVVKLLKPELAVGVSADRFRREILLAAALQHPHIVPILSAGELDDLPWFMMPFVEGESLRQRVATGPLPVIETVRILRDVARALGAAHALGIVHRDIKPDNVLLAAGSAMVADFGVAKAFASARREHHAHADATITTAGTSLGTPAYMAPEQVAADPAMDHRADIYAVGVMAYEMLTGAPPFAGRSPQQVMAAHLSEKVPPIERPGIPAALVEVVMRCLEKEPSARPQSADELLAALENPEVVSGAFVSAPQLRAVQRGVRRRRALIAAGLVALAGLPAAWLARREVSRAVVSQAGAEAAPAAAPAKATPSIAVLPLAYLGADQKQAFVADGIGNAITTSLARVNGLRVASRAAAAALQQRIAAGTATDTAVASLIEGVVEEERGKLRIAVRLVDARDGFTVWSDQFEGDRGSLFEMQDRIATSVAAAMADHFSLPLVAPPAVRAQ